jgi:rod shape determining protein RodA
MFLTQWFRQNLRGIPWPLLLTAYALITIGLYSLYSATGANVTPNRFYAQINWILIGSGLMIVIGLFIDIRTVERLTFLGYILVCLALFGVDFFGTVVKGSQRWLVLGPFRIQPSEPAKFIIILITARSFALMKGYSSFTLLDLWRQMILIGLPFLLILGNPDLGTAGLVAMIASAQILFVRVSWRSIFSVAVLGVTASAIAWNFVLYPYQKSRVLNFLNPMGDPQGAGYHSLQSMIAVGSGGLTGRGYQQGTQSQLNFLPERHTDFILSVFAEENGFVGCLVVAILFAALIVQLLQIATRARDTFCSLVVLGVAAFFAFHLFINVGMVVGLFPVVGVPLSLISYGGSHLITALCCLGLVIATERRRVAQ